MQSGDMKWFFDNDRSRHISLMKISILGYEFCLEHADRRGISYIFNLIKMKVNHYRNISSTDPSMHSEFTRFRRDVSFFLHNLKIQVAMMSRSTENAETASNILEELRKLCLLGGRLSMCDYVVQDNMAFNDSAVHYYHMLMDIWWCAFEVAQVCEALELAIVDPQLVRDPNCIGTFSSQLEKALLTDLVTISYKRFLHGIEALNPNINPFHCDCMKEMYVMLRIYIDRNDELGQFWKSFSSVIGHISAPSPSYMRYFPVASVSDGSYSKNKELFTLWLAAGLSKIYRYNARGVFNNDSEIVSCESIYGVIANLLKTEDSAKPRIPTVKYSLILSISLSELWSPTAEIILPFLDFFFKRLNKLDEVPFSAEESHLLPKSSKNWIDALNRQLLSDSHEFDLFKCLSKLFRITVIKLLDVKNGPQSLAHVQRIKGRLFSQIHPKRIEELSETGLFRLVTFFLIFMTAAPNYWSELSLKICEITKMVVQKFLDHGKTGLILRALFGQLHSKPANCDHSRVVAFISVIAERIVTRISAPDIIAHARQHDVLVSNLFVYLDEVRQFPLPETEIDYSTQNESAPSSTASVLRKELGNILFKLMEKLIFADFATSKKLEELMQIFFENMRQDGEGSSWINEWVMPFFKRFIDTYLGHCANSRLFKAMETTIQLCPEVVRGTETVYCVLSKAISKIESQRKIGTDEELRRLLRELVRKSVRN
ncbi:Protein MMS22-like [Halotydeus destructor]|nr:Protein MMS22-like [Halotydeus destructor]